MNIDNAMTGIDAILEQYTHRLDPDMASVAIRETLLNAAEHGNKKNKSCFVDIDIFPHQEDLTVLVSDEGPGFNYHHSKKEKWTQGSLSVQGRGLKAVAQIASGFDTIGGSVKLTFGPGDDGR